jgi:C-terminal processing protease CtpA/Prc
MRRAVLGLLACVTIVAACQVDSSGGSPAPTRTPDIKRAKLDIAYSAFVDQDVHHVTSKKALEGALEAVKAEISAAGGKADAATPQFQDVDEPQIADFKKFAEVVSDLALKNPQISGERIADAAVAGMIKTSPDCHTQYISASGRVYNSSTAALSGGNAALPAQGTSLGSADEAGLTGKILPGGIAYITWHQFVFTGTYKITEKVRAILDKAVAQGTRGWIFDLRGNLGGDAVDLTSMFLNGEPTYNVLIKTGNGGTASGNKDLRLPEPYQLPIVVVVNGRSASGSEIFALGLRENKRATIVGQKTVGCVGETIPTRMGDGSEIHVTVQELVGAVTGAKYNQIGIPPDVAADDATAGDKAIEVLKQKIAQ